MNGVIISNMEPRTPRFSSSDIADMYHGIKNVAMRNASTTLNSKRPFVVLSATQFGRQADWDGRSMLFADGHKRAFRDHDVFGTFEKAEQAMNQRAKYNPGSAFMVIDRETGKPIASSAEAA